MAHPEELTTLDLHEVWTTAAPLESTFDPFRFDHRMAAYRLMIDNTNRAGAFGADNRHNPLWGLAFQHQWQYRTGRLGTGTARDGRIDPDSPWGYGNYTLSVIPWLGAEAAGVVPGLSVADPPTPSRFRYVTGGAVPEELTAGVSDWRAYFTLVGESDQADPEPARLALWKAHKTCLDAVVATLTTTDTTPWPRQETTFLHGWCRMVDYLWAAALPTDFAAMTTHGLAVLPEKILTTPEDVHTLPPKIRGNVRTILGLATMPTWRYNLNLRLWKRIMRTRRARSRVIPLLDAVFNPRKENAEERRELLGHLLRP